MVMFHILNSTWLIQPIDHEMISTGRKARVVQCGGLLAIGGITGLLLVGATDCSATIHTANIKHFK
jgi:hypothetical protein